MKYKNITKGIFLERPNRFIAYVEVDGKKEICHVKNTGRCRELLIEGVTVILEKSDNPNRKTAYDLIAVYKGDVLFNIDSQAPNKVAAEYLKDMYPHMKLHPEYTFGDSRLDFYLEGEEPMYVEVKGCTLESEGRGYFPDAPTERGVKHLRELTGIAKSGGRAMILFIVAFSPVKSFSPNDITHKAFGDALREAKRCGVAVRAVDCTVTEDSLTYKDNVEIIL